MEDYGLEDDMDPEMRRVMELSRVTAQNDELKRMETVKQGARLDVVIRDRFTPDDRIG